jgi:hypothetical protein
MRRPPACLRRLRRAARHASASLAVIGWCAGGAAAALNSLSEIKASRASVVHLPCDGVRGIAVSGGTLWLLATGNRGLAAPETHFQSRILSLELATGAVDTLSTEADGYETGLAYDGAFLWSGGSLLGDHAGLFRIATDLGTVVVTLPSPGYHPAGLTVAGGYLWQADADSRKLYRLDMQEGKVSRKLPAPGFYPTGLTHDGSRFWCADASTGRLYRLKGFNAEPDGVVAADAFDFPGRFVSLAWDRGGLWAVAADDSQAVRIELGH